MTTIEERLTALENRKPQVGPRGPAGDYVAAAAHAAKAVENAEARVQAKANEAFEQFSVEVKALREEVKQLQQYLDERIKNVVDGHTVQVLRDYGVLDENHNPLNKEHVNLHLRQIGVLK